jgi:hypothetical protein
MLSSLVATAEQHHDPGPWSGEIEAVARPEIDAELHDAASYAAAIAEETPPQPPDSQQDDRGGSSVGKAIDPFGDRVAPVGGEAMQDLLFVHCSFSATYVQHARMTDLARSTRSCGER